MKSIVDTLKQKWADYLLEVVVIMIGILGAFALNSWKDLQKAQVEELQILKEFVSDIEEDGLKMRELRDRRRLCQQAIDNMLIYLPTGEITKDQFETDLGKFLTLERYFPIRSSYEIYKSRGVQISNQELRSKLARYYEFEQNFVQSSVKDIEIAFQNDFSSALVGHANIAAAEYGIRTELVDYTNLEFASLVKTLVVGYQYNHRNSLIKIENFVEINQSLLADVQEEIKRF